MGIGSLVCIINLLITPVANVLMRLGCLRVKELRILIGRDFFKPGNYHHESHTCACYSRSGEKHSTTSRVSPYTSFVL